MKIDQIKGGTWIFSKEIDQIKGGTRISSKEIDQIKWGTRISSKEIDEIKGADLGDTRGLKPHGFMMCLWRVASNFDVSWCVYEHLLAKCS